jgi:hypothetical protein
LQPLGALLQRGDIGQDEFSIDHLDIANGIDGSADVMDVTIVETPHHLDDCVDFADMTQELVTQTLALTCAADQPSNIDKLDRGWDRPLRLREHGKLIQPRVWNGHNPLVRLNGTERVVRRFRFPRPRDRVEKSGFADIRQTNNSGA